MLWYGFNSNIVTNSTSSLYILAMTIIDKILLKHVKYKKSRLKHGLNL